MEHWEGEITGEQGIRIWCQSWRPEAPKAVLVVIHGLGEHSGRSGHVVDYLVPRGYAIYALDHRGHGRSGGQRGHVGRFAEFTADLRRLIERVQAAEPGQPIFLLGHSLGGTIALQYALEHPHGLAGVIASSPGLARKFKVPRAKLFLGRLMSVLWPTLTFHSGLPADQLSHDPQVASAYTSDPLVHDLVTARLFTEVTRAGEAVLARAQDLKLPCLLLGSDNDPLVDSEAVRRFYAAVGTPDKALRLYEGFYHECFNEIGRERPLADLTTWLEAHLPT